MWQTIFWSVVSIPLIAVVMYAMVVVVFDVADRFFINPPSDLEPIPSDKLKAILEKESEFVANELALWVRAGDSRVITREVLKNIKDKERERLQIAKREAQRLAHREQQIELLGALQAKEGGR